jgi:putative membrane protein
VRHPRWPLHTPILHMSSPSLTVSTIRLALLTACVPIVALACANDDAAAHRDSVVAASEEAYTVSHRATAPRDTTDSTSVRAPVALTDNNILARLAQGDRLEVQAARIAVTKATGPALRTFARQLVDNHSRAENDARTLGQRLKIAESPAASDTTKAYQQKVAARLNALPKGLTFDTAYVRFLVDGHVAMVKDVKAMEAKASHPEVKRLLESTIPELERQLGRARALSKLQTPPQK